MANNYFQFKQFRIDQDNTSMKVCTDSCVFGAWIKPQDATYMLDIGAGTGLLSLMLAQRSKAFIDAVEIDEDAAKQAVQNIQRSPWSEKITVYHKSIQSFAKHGEKKYDLIISNPPFYTNYLKSEDAKTNIALHNTSLSTEELLQAVTALLVPKGRFIVLLPSYEAELLREVALDFNLYTDTIVKIKDHERANAIREITVFSYTLEFPKVEELILKKGETYSEDFVTLLKDYYLNL
ncbi:MAG TPA: methyltransferase [Cytophagaceae bacterium]|nr:methyltransferase [Cytophagaceae bacterium]